MTKSLALPCALLQDSVGLAANLCREAVRSFQMERV